MAGSTSTRSDTIRKTSEAVIETDDLIIFLRLIKFETTIKPVQCTFELVNFILSTLIITLTRLCTHFSLSEKDFFSRTLGFIAL